MSRGATHGGNVAQGPAESLPSDLGKRGSRLEMYLLDKSIGFEEFEHSIFGGVPDHSAIIANPA
jgi:hypothetical protein